MCKICNGEVTVIIDEQMNATYDECLKCGFIYQTSNYYDKDKELDFYSKHENSLENKGYVNYLEKFICEAVDPFVTKGLSLDYGCGPGPVLAHILNDRGFNTYTYDLHFNHSNDYDVNKYDLITSTEVWEDFKEPLDEIKKQSELLKSGGYISIMTSFVTEDIEFLNWWYRRDYTHISFYTLGTFEKIANKFDFEIVYTNNKNIIVMRKG